MRVQDPSAEGVLVVVADPSAISAGLRVARVPDPQSGLLSLDAGPVSILIVEPHRDEAALLELVQRVRRLRPCVIGVLASSPGASVLSLAERLGAEAVLAAPLDTAALRWLEGQRAQTPPPPLLGAIEGSETTMTDVWRLALVAARSTSSLLITGETGVGKEIHRFSARRRGPFVAVNCAALAETLLESELFGHERGAFTGAVAQHRGRFELAEGGTLLLDEIGDLPLRLQSKLLRVLQDHRIERVGGGVSLKVDVRVIAATNRQLDEDVQRGRFRPDLYYRIAVLSIHVPPLRDRPADVPVLWEHFVAAAARAEGRYVPPTSVAAKRAILQHRWPGNVRELANAAQHAVAVSAGEILPADLPTYLTSQRETSDERLAGLTLRELERRAILASYEAAGSVKAAAEVLGISVRKLHYRLREYRATGYLPGRPRPASSEVRSEAAKLRVLLAEDDDDLRWALADFLRMEGYDVIAVADGRALLEQLGAAMLLEDRASPADVIVSDVRMPGLTGMQLLESVRSRGWKLPVVLMSAFGDEELARRASDLGAKAFLHKPFDERDLRRAIESATSEPSASEPSELARS